MAGRLGICSERVLSQEIEKFQSLVLEMKSQGSFDPEQMHLLMTELEGRKDIFHKMTGFKYQAPAAMMPVEKKAIAAMFNNLKGNNWARKAGWAGLHRAAIRPEIRPLETNAGTYDGVETVKINSSESIITQMKLSGNGLCGECPSEICNLIHLEVLDLSHNFIRGKLPNMIGNMIYLRHLNLSSNSFSGVMSRTIASMTQLQSIDLSCNRIEGEIPDVFEDMRRLQRLNLSTNQLRGCLPPSMAKLYALEYLNLAHNQLEGELPKWIANWKEMDVLDVSHNRLSGNVAFFFPLRKITRLIASHNCLHGPLHGQPRKEPPAQSPDGKSDTASNPSPRKGPPLPQYGQWGSPKKEKSRVLKKREWSDLAHLDTLYLQNNQLEGPVPSCLFTMIKLKKLNLSNNCLRGVLPENLGTLQNLEVLILSGNDIKGPAPVSISDLDALHDLDLFKPYPARNSVLPRAFKRDIFERVYGLGPELGLDSVCWDNFRLFGEEAGEPIAGDLTRESSDGMLLREGSTGYVSISRQISREESGYL